MKTPAALRLALGIACALLAGCSQTPDRRYARNVNSNLKRAESSGLKETTEAESAFTKQAMAAFPGIHERVLAAKKEGKKVVFPRFKKTPYPDSSVFTYMRLEIQVAFVVEPDGRVIHARALNHGNTLLAAVAENSLRKWEAVPGMIDGKNAPFLFVVPFVFEPNPWPPSTDFSGTLNP